MKIRPIYAIGTLALLLALCGLGWLAFQPEDMEPLRVYKTVVPESPPTETAQAPLTAQRTQENKVPLTLEEQAEKRKRGVLENVRIIRGVQSDPYLEKLQRAMDSPAYLEYVKKQEAEEGYDAMLLLDFLKAQGVSDLGGKKFMENIFRIHFPEGEPADYEPMMRKQLAELALEYPTEDSLEILAMLREEPANNLWAIAHFNGWVGVYEWAENIHQNAGSILAEFTVTEERETAPPPTSPDSMPEPNLTEGAEETRGTQQSRREVPPQREAIEPLSENAGALEAEIVKDLFADIPNFPSEADFQKSLREQFSLQRFNTAMRTLSRHGPKEGLRRLKESDPEMATHLERFLQPKKEQE